MIPILYEAKTSDFTGNGTGFLKDATECMVKEVRNGTFELTLKYPENGVYADKLTEDAIIKAKPNNKDNDQLFRIYKSGKAIAGVNTFYAEHISYELNSNPICQPVIEGKNPQQAIEQVLSQAAVPNNYTAWSDIQTRNSTGVDDVISVRKMLGGVEGSILDTWGGEYQFDNFTIKLWKSRGKDTGETIRYGKNLITAEQEKNIANTVTAIFPYARYKKDETSEEEILVKLSEGIIKTPNADRYARLKCEPVDFSDKFKDGVVITEDMLRKVATAYAQSGIDEPSISIKASFQDMNKIKGNENLATFNSIDLCDIVTVIIEKLDIDVKAKVVSYTYNVLKERAEKVEIGETRTNLTKQITAESKEQADRIIKTATFSEKLEASLKQRIADATAAITGNSGGYVVLYPPENPQEIFVMDSPDTKTAKNVWRWNKAGLGHSSNGVNGPFNVAIRQDGVIIADFIGAGELDGMLIKAATIKAESLSVEYKKSVTQEAQELANQAENNANTATDDKLKNYSTTTEMQSALTVEAGKISAKVSETYETKENATQKMTDANNALESYKREASAAIELNANAIKSKVTADEVTSQIEQSAEAIRCQAKKISWKSENSEMTEDGKLSCQGAEISGTFKQVHGGKKSIDINNNEVKVFSWQNTGNFAGALGSVYVKNTGRDKVALWCDNNDIVSIGCQQEEGDTPNANIDAVIQIDAKTYKEQTPWIRNTASGKLFPENKEGVTVENGLIKGWDIEYASGTMSLISGLSWNNTGITKVERCNITIKNGIITGWDTTSKNY
jgi:phage minor structural protein